MYKNDTPDGTLPGLIKTDGALRCDWTGNYAGYDWYHDEEWGRPTKDDQRLYEKVCLEGFQAGLSWLTILKKRENFRAAFHNFEIKRVAAMTTEDVDRLVQNTGIIRHRKKIESAINNAGRALEMQREFGSLASYFWGFEAAAAAERPGPINYNFISTVTKTATSTKISKDLKKRSWSFVGPTTIYAFMQAMGLVNDHMEGCHLRDACCRARADFVRPT